MRVEEERMKESWKLIELLNEYIEEKELWNTVKEIDDDYFVNNYNNWDWYLCEEVISKKFWFIQRLVENDKIDRDSKNLELDMKRMRIPQDYYISWVQSLDIQHKKAQYLSLIALLSIQDNSIEFLISVLK